MVRPSDQSTHIELSSNLTAVAETCIGVPQALDPPRRRSRRSRQSEDAGCRAASSDLSNRIATPMRSCVPTQRSSDRGPYGPASSSRPRRSRSPAATPMSRSVPRRRGPPRSSRSLRGDQSLQSHQLRAEQHRPRRRPLSERDGGGRPAGRGGVMPDSFLLIALTIRKTPIIFGFSWGVPIWLRTLRFWGLEKLGFPWILSSELRLINELCGIFRKKFFAGPWLAREAETRVRSRPFGRAGLFMAQA